MPPSAPRHRRGLVAAAVLVLALGIGDSRSGNDLPSTGAAEVTTDAGETTTVQLADGTFVRLAPDSRLRFDPVRSARQVWLDGRAFFAVASAQRPFTVRTAAGQAVVLGTRFDLSVRDDDLRLVVVEGRVALEARGQRVEVGKGEMSRSAGEPGLQVTYVEDVYELLDWMGQSLMFQATPLSDVVAEIGRVYDAEVLIRDPSISDRTFTASFNNRSFEDVMSVVCEVLSLDCTIDDSRARIDGVTPPSPRPPQVAPQERR